ncbi:hypothetical protein DCMF_00520 [Candidatus Formimonas warabiya]|uniref:Tripartite tricarboxylate transporter substrate binding protein n=1 Tax=Formimonas warabiya TaxID=1761012 RepID=A0A3G1L0E8_FORW1|nr:hypothetical protein DCMF_00520 [Candidatus Formimonas warabiya]
MTAACSSGTQEGNDTSQPAEPEKISYPEKPIDFIVPFAAGGGTDLNARVIEKLAEKYLGQPVVIVNKEGAGGQVGYELIAQAKPDGYTIGYLNLPGAIQIAADRETKYDPLNSYEPIIMQVLEPKLVAVRKEAPWQTMQEYIDYAKANPGKSKAANNGPGSANELAMKMFADKAQIEVTHVPYDGAGKMMAALLGGHVDIAPLGVSEFNTNAEQLRVLAVFSKERIKELKDAPTAKEQGLDLDLSARRGIVAPKGTPQEIVNFLHDNLKKMWEDPEYIQMMEQINAIPLYMNGEDFTKRIQEEQKMIDELAK